jgi:protein-tyrosine phosphatase
MIHVLFVCLGNICRSPTAEAVFRRLVEREGLSDRISVDSVGTGDWHVGKPPDRRSQEAAKRRDLDLSALRARSLHADDFAAADYILAMDRANLHALQRACPPHLRDRLHLFLDFVPHLPQREVPDPYGGGPEGFERVLDLVETGAAGLLAHLRRAHRL